MAHAASACAAGPVACVFMKTSLIDALVALTFLSATVAPGCATKEKSEDSSKDKKSRGDDDDDDEREKKKKKKKEKKESDSAEKPVAKTSEPTVSIAPKTAEMPPPIKDSAPPSGPVTDPSQQTYPDVSNKIADSCATASVIMTTAPNSVGIDYPWTWTRQAMLANQQFKIVSGDPRVRGEVAFEMHLASDKHQNAWVLVAKCGDGLTCNKLAAVNKAVVKGSTSQPVCGALPMDLSPATRKKPVLRELGNPQNKLPDSKDVPGQCVRLHACSIAMDPPNKAGKETLGLDCQKAPSNFKTSCATRYPCAEVMTCLGR
jgi:Ni/Co efflux regulator RcnB